MKLAVRTKIDKRVPDQLREAAKVLDGCGDYDNIERQVLQYIRIEFAVYKFQIALFAENAGRLTELAEIRVQADNTAAGDG